MSLATTLLIFMWPVTVFLWLRFAFTVYASRTGFDPQVYLLESLPTMKVKFVYPWPRFLLQATLSSLLVAYLHGWIYL